MHLGIDVREACGKRRTGKAWWTHGCVSELLTRTNVSLTLFTDSPLPPEWQEAVRASARRVRVVSMRPGLLWHLRTARMLRKMDEINVYIATVSYIVPFLLGSSRKHVVIVHDLIAFRGEPHDRKATLIERLTLRRAAFTAHRVCTVSETTRADLLSRYPSLDPTRVTPVFAAQTQLATQGEEPSGKKHVLCIATLCPRKNQLRLIRAHASLSEELRNKHPLVLVGGRGWMDENIVALAQSTPGVEWKGFASDEECRRLLAHAIVFAYPSLYEGFGLPILDAFSAGVPVLTSDRGSMKEIAHEAALLVNPENEADIRNGLGRLLENALLRSELARKGYERMREYTWKRTADAVLAVCR